MERVDSVFQSHFVWVSVVSLLAPLCSWVGYCGSGSSCAETLEMSIIVMSARRSRTSRRSCRRARPEGRELLNPLMNARIDGRV
jgi:hypothetical protein